MKKRRVLVAIDASPHSLAAVEAAVEMAVRMEAELLGLFIEDINLLRLADLPFAREICFPSARSRKLDSGAMERRFQEQAGQAKRAVAHAAERMHVKWSFRTARGSVVSELLLAAQDVDLVTIGKTGAAGVRSRLGSTAVRVLENARGAVLLLHHGSRIGTPVSVLFDGSPASKEALAAAANLARARNDVLIIFVAASTREEARSLEQALLRDHEIRGIRCQYHRLVDTDVAGLVQTVKIHKAGVLFLHASSLLFEGQGLQQLINEIECPVYLLR